MAAATETGETIVATAALYLGIHEEPPASNRGVHIDRWNLAVGNQLGDPWCAAFACSMAAQAGVKGGPWTGSSGAVADWGEAHNAGVSGADISAGCLGAVIDSETSTGHCHTVIAASAPDGEGWVDTIEGNEGNAVKRNRRTAASVDWVEPWAAEVKAQAEPA